MNNEPNISLYGSEASTDDFPVLKAFQQYIDAEQAKARRRLLTVSIFFGAVLIAVIVVFSCLMVNSYDRNQTLNDRLLEYVMRDNNSKVESARDGAIQAAAVKSMNETLERLQRQLAEQERKANDAASNAAKELASAKNASAAVDAEAERRQSEATARLQQELALLKAEKAKLAEEKEKLRQEELERYRREHYPEYYAKKEGKNVAGKTLKPIDIDEILEEDEEEVETVEPPTPVVTPSSPKKEIDLDEDEAIEYFKDDTYTIPVEVKGKRAGWRVPLN